MVDKIDDNFHGCYLLTNGRGTYIGYTVNPLRRVEQHNCGREKGGAKRTENRGTWSMVLIVHGFMSNISALQFEWAWQHPYLSKKVKDKLGEQRSKKALFSVDYQLKILGALLSSPPWTVLPLRVRWVTPSLRKDLNGQEKIPPHIITEEGPFESAKSFKKCGTAQIKKKNGINYLEAFSLLVCCFCDQDLAGEVENFALCPNEENLIGKTPCTMQSHLTCWAKWSLDPNSENHTRLIPIQTTCPKCESQFMWADIVRFKLKNSYRFCQKALAENKTKQVANHSLNDSLGELLKMLDDS